MRASLRRSSDLDPVVHGVKAVAGPCVSGWYLAPACPRSPGFRGRPTGGSGGSGSGDVLRLRALLALRDVEGHGLALLELTVTVARDVGVVREDVRSAAVLRDEAETLFGVEPLHGSAGHGHAFQSRSDPHHADPEVIALVRHCTARRPRQGAGRGLRTTTAEGEVTCRNRLLPESDDHHLAFTAGRRADADGQPPPWQRPPDFLQRGKLAEVLPTPLVRCGAGPQQPWDSRIWLDFTLAGVSRWSLPRTA